MASRGEKASSLRQDLREKVKAQGELLDVFFDRHPLIRGQVYETRGRCGKATCHCAKGEGHPRVAFGTRTADGQKTRSISPNARLRLEPLTLQYRRFREARAELVRLNRSILETIDALEEALSVEVNLDALNDEE